VTRLYQGIMDSFTPVEIPEYTVPRVIGKTVEEAQAMEAVSGSFEIVVDEDNGDFSTEYAAGQIISQSPEADKKGKNASGDPIPITVTLSLGARSGEMLYLVGEDARNAKLKLEQTKGLSELHLNVVISEEEEYHEEIEAGHVIRTNPSEGTSLSEGDTITLIVSKGPEPKTSVMVSCVGESVESVKSKMDTLNLIAEFQKVEGSAEEGTVLSQSVDTGTEVLQGSTVTFTYSDGEKLIAMPVVFVTPPSEEDVRVQIFLDNDNVLDAVFPGEYTLEENIYAKAGSYRLRIYADDQMWRDEVVTFSESGGDSE